MLNWIIDWSLRHRFFVLLVTAALAVGGAVSLRYLDIDAFPDTTPVQVQINTVVPALDPEQVEQRITIPIEQKIGGLPRLQQMRSVSKFGLSQVVVTFDDGTDIYFARQLINERLGTVELPQRTERPQMGPLATGLGEVFHYVLTSGGNDLTELRTIHDWNIKPKLRAVRGTAEINSWGGNEKQYQVRIDPDRLIRHGLSFDEVVQAVREKNNFNVGGGAIRQGSQMLLVQGVGRTTSVEDIKAIDITSKDGAPIRVGDVADVEIGREIRRGAVTADGKGEVVLGLGFMLMGENSHQVTWSLKNRLDEIKPTLPRNVKVETVYDRTELVSHVIDTVRENLFEGGLLVVAILFLFLGNLRAACIVALAIPLSMLFAFAGMLRFGIAASLLSLGAIDFGMVVDSSVVMVENCVRHIARSDLRGRSFVDVVREAAVEVRKPTLFGELIIMIVYLPILTLQGIEGKLFRPMAMTVIFALAGSMVLSLTLMPVLASLVLPRYELLRQFFGWLYGPLVRRLARHGPLLAFTFQFCVLAIYAAALLAIGSLAVLIRQLVEGRPAWPVLLVAALALMGALLAYTLMRELAALLFPRERQAEEREPLLMRLVKWLYKPILRFAMEHRLAMLLFAALVLFAAGMIALNIGSEFVPKLSEGAITINVVRLAGTDLEESIHNNTQMEKAILGKFPNEVAHVWSRIGTAEVATDPMGVELTDVFIALKPSLQWRATNEKGRRVDTQAELSELIEKEVRDLPGQKLSFSQPIAMRIDEMVSGVKSQVAVKVFGDDLNVMKTKALEVAQVLQSIPGNADVNVEQVTGQPVLRIQAKPETLSHYGLSAKAVLELVESVGSKPLGEVVEGQLRFPLVVRLPEINRASKESIEAMPVTTPSGDQIPLSRLAKVEILQGPSTITREWGQRRITVTCNVRGRDMGSFVAEAQERVRDKVAMPSDRYHVQWGGQFENLINARKRLLLVIPLALAIILGLIYLTYQNMVDTIRVFAAVPFACVGGLIALWLREMPFSISAAVGFIALSGVAVLDDMILVSYVRQLREKGMPIMTAVREGALTRLRPVLMTTLVASLGFVPMALSTGMGAEVQRPLATVVIGGVVSAMVMSLTVGRMLYLVFDDLARWAFWVLHRVLGVPVAVLNPAFGFHGANGDKEAQGIRRGATGGLSQGTENVHI